MPKWLLLFRLLAQFLIAVCALALPAMGDNRFLLAAILLCVTIPGAVVIHLRFQFPRKGWIEPLFDLCLVVILIHFVPQLWHAALCIALMVALAPSVSLHPRGSIIYAGYGVFLVSGLGLAAWLYDVDNWFLPLLGVVITYPSLIFYSHWQVQRANELRERSQLLQGITQLAGSVAHDFNNVLTGVSGYAELALHDLPDPHPARDSLNEVINGVSRASLLSNQLLSFAGREVHSQARINLGEEVLLIADLLQAVVPRGVTIKTSVPANDMYVRADQSQLQQVIMNIILNAGEATTQTPSSIDLTLSETVWQGEPSAILSITDQGIGIPEQTVNRIFDPFFTTKPRGHGLGLASVMRIMEHQKGSVEVASKLGEGSTFTLRWPLDKAATESHDRVHTDTFNSLEEKQGQILVVDDEPAVREVAAGLLRHLDFSVVQATNADQAIELYRAHQATCIAILLDLSMPGKDGWACLQDLREIDQNVPVIICSGYDPQASGPQQRDDPKLAFLSKPFSQADLAGTLSRLLNPATP